MIERIEPLGPHHDRGAFSCGVQEIDDHLIAFNFEHQAPGHRLYVAVDVDGVVLGYYSLRPTVWKVKDARGRVIDYFVELEVAMLGVTNNLQGQGIIGIALITHAYETVLKVIALIGGIQRLWVGPLNPRCRNFYEKVGFVGVDNGSQLYITVSEIADALSP